MKWRLTDIFKIAWGSSLAQAIGFASLPLLSYFYTPSDFGLFGFVFFGSQLLGAAMAGRYEQAIMLARRPEGAIALCIICLLIATAFTVAAVPVALFIDVYLSRGGGTPTAYPVTAAVVIGFFISLSTTLTTAAIRNGRFNLVSINRAIKAILAPAVQVAIGLAGIGSAGGLIVGEMVAALAAAAYALNTTGNELFRTLRAWPPKRLHSRWLGRYLASYARRHVDFLTVNLPHTILNSAANLIVVALITSIFASAAAGAYFMMYRIAMLPASLMGTALSQLYFRSASIQRREQGCFDDALKQTLAMAAGIGCSVAIVLFVSGPLMFSLVLGDHWRLSGTLAQAFAPYVAPHLILASLAPTAAIAGKMRWALALNIAQSGLFIATLLYFSASVASIETALYWASIATAPFMLSIAAWYWHLSKQRSPQSLFSRTSHP